MTHYFVVVEVHESKNTQARTTFYIEGELLEKKRSSLYDEYWIEIWRVPRHSEVIGVKVDEEGHRRSIKLGVINHLFIYSDLYLRELTREEIKKLKSRYREK